MLINYQSRNDERGSLTILEDFKEIPFNIKRVYYLSKTPQGVSRGFHAHKKLEQIAISICGSCEIILDDGRIKKKYQLNSDNFGLYIGNYMWREIHNFSNDCILLVLASDLFDEDDYIRDYDIFKKLIQNEKK